MRPRPAPVIVLLGAAVAAGIYGYSTWSVHRVQPVTPAAPIPADAQAAVLGISAIYTIDYQEPASAWLSRVCSVSTQAGCQFTSGYVAAMVQLDAQKYQIQTGCSVTPVEAVDTLADGARVWKLQVHLDHPWPGAAEAQDVYALVTRDENGPWKFERLLFSQESAQYEEVSAK